MTQILLLALALTGLARGEELRVCVTNEGLLAAGVRSTFQSALAGWGKQAETKIRFTCSELRAPFLVVTLRETPRSTQPETALAALRTQDGKLLPQMEIYLKPIRGMLPSRLEVVEGRALAWVAGHEIQHYLRNTANHEEDGYFAAGLTQAILLRDPTRPSGGLR